MLYSAKNLSFHSHFSFCRRLRRENSLENRRDRRNRNQTGCGTGTSDGRVVVQGRRRDLPLLGREADPPRMAQRVCRNGERPEMIKAVEVEVEVEVAKWLEPWSWSRNLEVTSSSHLVPGLFSHLNGKVITSLKRGAPLLFSFDSLSCVG